MKTISIQRWNKYICCQKQYFTPAMEKAFVDLDGFLAKATLLKDDDTSTVGLIEIDKQKMILKRSNTKSIIHFFRRMFQISRAQKNWEFAKKLEAANILTFEPIALIEERFGFLRGRSYFLCSYLDGIDALHYFAHDASPKPNWPVVAKRIVLLLKALASRKLYHQDLNLSNIILIDDKPHLIDLDSMKANRFGWSKNAILSKLYRRFMENWDEAPGVSKEVVSLFQMAFYDTLSPLNKNQKEKPR